MAISSAILLYIWRRVGCRTRAKSTSEPELNPVSAEWSDWEYCYSPPPPPLDGMLTAAFFTPGWRETMWGKVSCLRKQHNGRDWASNHPSPDLKSNPLTTTPPQELQVICWVFRLTRVSCYLRFGNLFVINPLSPNINMYVLPTLPHIFLLTRHMRTWLNIGMHWLWWSFPLFS